jgi:hypothetical protein
VAQWSKAVPLEILGSASVAAGRNQEIHGAAYNWPSVVRVSGGFGWHVPWRTSGTCGGPGALHGSTVFPDTSVRLASGLSGHCVKKQCSLVGLCFG